MPLEKCMRRFEESFQMDLKEIGCDIGWIHQYSVIGALVSKVIKFLFQQKADFLTKCATISFSRKILLYEVGCLVTFHSPCGHRNMRSFMGRQTRIQKISPYDVAILCVPQLKTTMQNSLSFPSFAITACTQSSESNIVQKSFKWTFNLQN